jgi:hypothetical protein
MIIFGSDWIEIFLINFICFFLLILMGLLEKFISHVACIVFPLNNAVGFSHLSVTQGNNYGPDSTPPRVHLPCL